MLRKDIDGIGILFIRSCWNILPKNLRDVTRRAFREVWRLRRVPRAPFFETWVVALDTSNRRYHRRILKERTSGHSKSLRPWRARPIPRILWLHWAQGLEAAPPVVKLCVKSWQRRNPGWDIRIIDAEAAGKLVSLIDVSENLPHMYRADALRLRLLRSYGGVWADATTWCHRPLDEWLPLVSSSGFFVFSPAGPSRRLDNWFIASTPGHPLVSAWDDEYSHRIAGLRSSHPAYFIHIYALQWRLLFDKRARHAWRQMARLPAPPCFLMASALNGDFSVEDTAMAIANGLPVSKLSWRMRCEHREFIAKIERIDPDF